MISLYIISFYKFNRTLTCLESIRDNLECDYEVVLVENASADETTLQRFDSLAAEWPCLKIIRLPEQQPCPRIRSKVLEFTQGEHIFFMDNDCYIENDFFPELVELLERDPKTGGVCTALLYHPKRTLQCLGITLDMVNGDCFHPRHLYHEIPYDEVKHMKPFKSEFIPGGCSLFKRTFLEQNTYDSGLKNVMGDYDLCLQGRQKGYTYMVHPGCYVVHDKTDPGEDYLRAKAALTDWVGGVLRFHKKWGLLYYIYPEYQKGNIELYLGQFARWIPKEKRRQRHKK